MSERRPQARMDAVNLVLVNPALDLEVVRANINVSGGQDVLQFVYDLHHRRRLRRRRLARARLDDFITGQPNCLRRRDGSCAASGTPG